MKFKFKHLGFIDHGEIELGDLTVILGANNVSKTYVSYIIYGFLKNYYKFLNLPIDQEIIEKLESELITEIDVSEYFEHFNDILNQLSSTFTKYLHVFFNTDETHFKNTHIFLDYFNENFVQQAFHNSFEKRGYLIKYSKEASSYKIHISIDIENTRTLWAYDELEEMINQILSRCLFNIEDFPRPFVITSERTGISLFYKELDFTKNAILDQLSAIGKDQKFNFVDFINKTRSRYAVPIKDNIDIIRDYDTLSSQKSFLMQDESFKPIIDLLSDVVGGSYKFTQEQVYFIAKKEYKRPKTNIPMYVASSSVKSLFLLDFYIRHLAKKGDLLIIDEPELNLHPDKQRKIAGLLIQLINSGIKILITTHSDFLVRELNSRIVLSNLDFNNEKDKSFLKKYKLTKEDCLNPNHVKAYMIHQKKHEIIPILTNNQGMDTTILDEKIEEVSELFDDIYYYTLDKFKKHD